MDFNALGARAASEGADQTQAKKGGSEPLKAGPCRLRFISYMEVGKHKRVVKGVEKTENQVVLQFEVSGPNHPPREHEGVKYPAGIITITLNLSLNEKAHYFKLFQRMNYAGKAQHMVQLLGSEYLGTIYHRSWKGTQGDKIEAELHNADGYSIRPPRFADPETGAERVVVVDPPISKLKAFLWDYADAEQWASIFIDGYWEEKKNDKGEVTSPKKSKNWIQGKIAKAVNFTGSPAHALLAASGQAPIDLPDSESGRDALGEDGGNEDGSPPWEGKAQADNRPDPLGV